MMTGSERRVTESGETFPCRWKDLCFQDKRDLVWWIFPSIVLSYVETPHLDVSSEKFSVWLIQLFFFPEHLKSDKKPSDFPISCAWLAGFGFSGHDIFRESASPNIPKVYVVPGSATSEEVLWSISVEGLAFASGLSGMSGSTKDSIQTLNEKLEEGIAGKPQIFLGGEDFWKKLLTAIWYQKTQQEKLDFSKSNVHLWIIHC